MANERFACRLITSTRTDFCLTILSRGVAKQNFDRMFAGKSDILTQILAGSSCIYTCVPMHNRHFIPRARHSVFSDCCHDWQLVSKWAKWRRHQVIVVTNDCSPPAVWVTKFAGESPYAPKNIRQRVSSSAGWVLIRLSCAVENMSWFQRKLSFCISLKWV